MNNLNNTETKQNNELNDTMIDISYKKMNETFGYKL